jgi:hypothetical protein
VAGAAVSVLAEMKMVSAQDAFAVVESLVN